MPLKLQPMLGHQPGQRRPPRPQEPQGHGMPHFHIVTWHPDPLAQLPAEAVCLLVYEILESPVLFRFGIEKELITFISVLAGMRKAVWPRAEPPDLCGKPLPEPQKFSSFGRG